VNAPRTRILLVTRNLPPLVGGMERLNWHMAEQLAKVAEVRVVGPRGSAALAPAGIVVREAPLKPLWRFLWRARALARREAKTWRPQIVLAGSGLTAPIVRSAARVGRARTAAYVHGLDVAVQHPVYRAVWLPALRRMDRVIANSRATAELCRGIGVDPARVGVVHPGVELPPEAMSLKSPLQAKDEAGAPPSLGRGSARSAGGMTLPEGYPLLLSVGRLSARKGLREFVSQALPRIVAEQPGALLLIVGDAPNQALRAEAQTPESIQAAADAAGVGQHIRFLGKVADDELSTLYRAADVHVFPIRAIAGDPEGFGMVAVEAAAHGLPTVAFAAGGVVDAVDEGRSGYLVKPGDYAAFANAVLTTVVACESLRSSCVTFARRHAWTAFGDQFAAELPGFPVGVPRAPASSIST
jgi:phosphatidylinositol alpha-1,6-mannosyltransferase